MPWWYKLLIVILFFVVSVLFNLLAPGWPSKRRDAPWGCFFWLALAVANILRSCFRRSLGSQRDVISRISSKQEPIVSRKSRRPF